MKGLLKFITCGSVDDGKSTLIGHILYDAKLLYADQEQALQLESKVGSRAGAIDYSLLLDGLMAEREQGITIDVAYRYFTTDNRSFIVADTPGHEEYTRNMAVGASFADLAIILVDAAKGVLVQTRRHARICSLMGIRHFVFAINKMDLEKYSEERYHQIEKELQELIDELSLEDVAMIPLSATEGDNVTEKSPNMPWYAGKALLPYLEEVDVVNKSETGFVFPIQRVCRPNHTFRGFAGQIEAGSVKVGDEITTLPSNEKAVVKSILVTDKQEEEAITGQAVTIQLDREVDVSRGCVFVKGAEVKAVKQAEVSLLWMDDKEFVPGEEFLIKAGTKLIPGALTEILYKIDVNTGEHLQAGRLQKNEIARCRLVLSQPVVLDRFHTHKALGELIVIDRVTNMTSACGVVEAIVDGEKDDYLFRKDDTVLQGNLFTEYIYNIDIDTINKKTVKAGYKQGDEIPLTGESYQYPKAFDILFLKEQAAVQIRDGKVADIIPLASFAYTAGTPVLNEYGAALAVNSEAELEALKEEYQKVQYDEFLNKWSVFQTYRKIVFHSKW